MQTRETKTSKSDEAVDKLSTYAAKRDFSVTPEPKAETRNGGSHIFVVQEHHARKLHYDFRLEHEGVLKSWAVPKGVPEVAGEKRLAVEAEDHPLNYADFEGVIPEGEYGAGTVLIWDKGSFEPKTWSDKLIEVKLRGQKLKGTYVMVRLKKTDEKNWLLFKRKE